MVRKETLQQFEELQRESALVVEHLRSLMPMLTAPQRSDYDRPHLSVIHTDEVEPEH